MTQTINHQATAASTTTAPTFDFAVTLPPVSLLVPLTGALVVLAAALIGALFAARVKRAATAQAREILGSCADLSRQIEALQAALGATDARIGALAARQDEHSRSTQGGAPTSYNVAIRLARSGASRQELISTCGVTQQEADLVLRLHAAEPGIRTAA